MIRKYNEKWGENQLIRNLMMSVLSWFKNGGHTPGANDYPLATMTHTSHGDTNIAPNSTTPHRISAWKPTSPPPPLIEHFAIAISWYKTQIILSAACHHCLIFYITSSLALSNYSLLCYYPTFTLPVNYSVLLRCIIISLAGFFLVSADQPSCEVSIKVTKILDFITGLSRCRVIR